MKNFLFLLAMTLFLVSCGNYKEARSFKNLLEESSGDKYKIAKLDTETGNYVVYKNKTTGEFVAYNMDKFDRKTMTDINAYMTVATEGVDVVRDLNEFTERDSYRDSQGRTRTRTDTYYYKGDFIFSNSSGSSKDLETMASLEEEAIEQFMAYKLASDFSLSESRAQELARLASRYQKLESIRELTTSEKDQFALTALGVSYLQIEYSLREKSQGNEKGFQEVLEKAAAVNRTTPEQIGRFFTEVLNDELI